MFWVVPVLQKTSQASQSFLSWPAGRAVGARGAGPARDDMLEQPVHHVGGILIQGFVGHPLVFREDRFPAHFDVLVGIRLIVDAAVSENLIRRRHFAARKRRLSTRPEP